MPRISNLVSKDLPAHSVARCPQFEREQNGIHDTANNGDDRNQRVAHSQKPDHNADMVLTLRR